MFKIGIIGAGTITPKHITAYQANPLCEVVSIADINPAQAQKTANEYGIKNVYTDYHDILNDESIDAVSIATPTFIHKDIAIDAIKAHKHILCEKPPALNADEAKEIQKALEGYDKTFMFAFVRRFNNKTRYLKEYIDSGKMGKVLSCEAIRYAQMAQSKGWFARRELGGGSLIDASIHELDFILYLMDYPKAKSVLAYESHANNKLCSQINSKSAGYPSADANSYEKNTEDFLKAFITFENDTTLYIKCGNALLLPKPGYYCELNGERAGIINETFNKENPVKLIEVTDDLCLNERLPEIAPNNPFNDQINHFIDCAMGKTECIVKVEEGVQLMEIITAAYESAKTGMPIIINK